MTDAYSSKDFAHAIKAAINNPTMFSKRKELGELIFKYIPKERLPEYFIGLIKHVAENPNYCILKVKNDMTLLPLLVQAFFAWLLSLKYSKPKKNGKTDPIKEAEEVEEMIAAVEDTESVDEASPSKMYPNAVNFTDDDKNDIIKTLAAIEFPPANKVLHLAIKAMDVPPEIVVNTVRDLAAQGKAAFSSLLIVLSEPILNKLPLWPELLNQCLLLGKTFFVTATQVESFAAPLSESERKVVRDNLNCAEQWACRASVYAEAFEKLTHRKVTDAPPFDVFRNHIITVMDDLKHKNRGKTAVDPQAAMGVIRQTALKRYKKNEVNNEQLLDLIFCVVKHQPTLKNYVVKLIEKTYGDVGLASKIKQLDFRNMKLNINFADADIYEVRDKYLSIPNRAKVNSVNKIQHLKLVLHDLEAVANSEYPYVGLDAEWSPYLAKPRASILQLALQSVIYIIDIDALVGEKELSEFFDKLFGNDKICKIGFRFSEDLTQLRGCAPHCLSLYEPKNLICVQTLFFDLIKLCHKNFGNELDGLLVPSEEPFVANPEIVTLEDELADPDFDETDIIRTREKLGLLLEGYKERDRIRKTEQENDIALNQIKYMGLASVCARVLGKKLDKSEQCSAWDRRPLRKTQLRYAALDAYCILMIIDKFNEFCKLKNVDIKPLIAKQPSLRTSLPLFFSIA